MNNNIEPSLQELIKDSIDKKKAVKVKVVKVNKKEQTKSFKPPKNVEIGEEFIDRSAFRNGQNKGYNPNESLDPEFLRSLRENFGGQSGVKKAKNKKEFKINIPDEDYVEDYYDDDASQDFVQESYGMRNQENEEYDDYEEDFDIDEDYEKPPRRTVKKKRRIFSKLLGIIIILLIALGAGLYLAVSRYAGLFNSVATKDRLNISNVVSDDKVFNILFIGTDTREEGRNGLSDSMILISINEKTDEIVMSSFMRDMNVQIPGMDNETWHKLNWAHSKGGPELLMDTLEFNFGVEIDYYATVDFLSFAEIIDCLGGLEIEITDAEAKAMQDPMREQNRLMGKPHGTDYLYDGGRYFMNGNQALAYSRIRKNVGDDFARTERQRKVLELMSEKLKTMGIKELDEFLQSTLPKITTNMEKKTISKLMISSPFYIKYNKVSQRIPYGDNKESWDYASTSDGSVIKVDFDANKKYLIDSIYRG